MIYYSIRHVIKDKRATATTAQRILSVYHMFLLAFVLVFAVMASVQLDVHYAEWPLVFIPFWLMLLLMMVFLPTFMMLTEETLMPRKGRLEVHAEQEIEKPLEQLLAEEGIEEEPQEQAPQFVTTMTDADSNEARNLRHRLMIYIAIWESVYVCATAFSILLVTRDVRDWNIKFIPVWAAVLVWIVSLVVDIVYAAMPSKQTLPSHGHYRFHRTRLDIGFEVCVTPTTFDYSI